MPSSQSIIEIEGLEDCKKLQKLWLMENYIERIQGLEALQQLREVYLYTNKITKIEGLSTLTKLEVLWLSDNYISRIEGLTACKRLRELNLARNDIDCISEDTALLSNLTSLNLADNKISNFQELRVLGRLPKLVELCLFDPMWGDSPVALLCNYQTNVLYILPQLTSLDTLILAEEAKMLAQTTYLKKQMYYNMRIKTARRNVSNVLRMAVAGKRVRLGPLHSARQELVQLHKSLAQRLEEAALYRPLDADQAAAMVKKAEATTALLDRVRAAISDIEDQYAKCCGTMYSLLEHRVRQLHMELESGGNIRLENGKPSDAWYQSCAQMVQKRCFVDEWSGYSITGVQVLGVSRIHNRYLQQRYDKRLARVVKATGETHKRYQEHLFAGEHPALPDEIGRIIQDGFRAPGELVECGLDGAVRLANCVNLADAPRLHAQVQLQKRSPKMQPCLGKVVVARAFLGGAVQDKHAVSSDDKTTRTDGPLVVAKEHPGKRSVYRLSDKDKDQRAWFMFDEALVLPEFVIEFQYTLGPESVLLVAPDNATVPPSVISEALELLDPDLRTLAAPLGPWLALSASPEALTTPMEEDGLCQQAKEMLLAAPVLPPPRQVQSLQTQSFRCFF